MNKNVVLGLCASLLLAAPAALRADAGASYAKYCASCHGKDGAGHTKAGRLVKVKDLSDAAYQKTFSDETAFKDLKDGLTDSDGKVRMKPLKDKLSDDEIKAVVAYVRTLAK